LPIGLDLGIPALLLLDWIRPSAFLRTAAWSLAAGSVLANGTVDRGGLRDRLIAAVMPALAALIIEAARHMGRDAEQMDRIRLSRYLVAPIRTVRLRARMISWEVTSYARALWLESAILYARAVLVAEYGTRSWRLTRKRVPVILIHQLRTGQLPDELSYAPAWQQAVRDWVRTTLDELDPDRAQGPADVGQSEAVPEPVPAAVVQRSAWDQVWDRLDEVVSAGLTPDQALHVYGVARSFHDQHGRHIRGSRLANLPGLGKVKALAAAEVLETIYQTATGAQSPGQPRPNRVPRRNEETSETGHGLDALATATAGLQVEETSR
jgi:hypothetical protein